MQAKQRAQLLVLVLMLVLFALSWWVLSRRAAVPAPTPAKPDPVATGSSSTVGPALQQAAPAPSIAPPADEQPAEASGQNAAVNAEETPPVGTPETKPKSESSTAKESWKVDFVQKDIQTVIHYLALRTGLGVIIDGNIDLTVTVLATISGETGEEVNAEATRLIEGICRSNGLAMTQGRTTIMITRKPGIEPEPSISRGTVDGRWNVNFAAVTVQDAAVRLAGNAKIDLSMPVVSSDEKLPRINLYMREAEPASILRAIAAEAGLELVESQKEGVTSYEMRRR